MSRFRHVKRSSGLLPCSQGAMPCTRNYEKSYSVGLRACRTTKYDSLLVLRISHSSSRRNTKNQPGRQLPRLVCMEASSPP